MPDHECENLKSLKTHFQRKTTVTTVTPAFMLTFRFLLLILKTMHSVMKFTSTRSVLLNIFITLIIDQRSKKKNVGPDVYTMLCNFIRTLSVIFKPKQITCGYCSINLYFVHSYRSSFNASNLDFIIYERHSTMSHYTSVRITVSLNIENLQHQIQFTHILITTNLHWQLSINCINPIYTEVPKVNQRSNKHPKCETYSSDIPLWILNSTQQHRDSSLKGANSCTYH